MGLLDYYRQFEGMSEEEVNEGLRENAAERKRKALTRVETLDLSHTTWPELPHPRIVNAITYVARRGLYRYPHLSGSELRHALAERHGVEPGRLILGNGAAELLSAATRALIEPGQQLLTPWPSYPLYPIMARRAHGVAVRVAPGVDALLEAAAAEPAVRVIALASPNDPTGELLATAELQRLLDGLPEGVAVLLDESLVEFADAQPTASSLALLESHPRLLVFRSFSKAWGLAGMRIGYAIGAPGSEELLAELEPDLGVSEVSQAGALEALRSCSELTERRVRTICAERPRMSAALRAARLRGQRLARPTSCGSPTRACRAQSSPRAWRNRACSWPRATRSASRATCASVSSRPTPPSACSTRSTKPSRGDLPRARLTQQRAGGPLQDLPPGADLLVLLVEVLDHLAHPLGGDVQAVTFGHVLIAVVFPGQLLGDRLEAVAGDLHARGEAHHRGLEHQFVGGLRLDQHDVHTRIALLPALGQFVQALVGHAA